MCFSDLMLAEPILRALKEQKYVQATPIQSQAIPRILQGNDILGCAQTGTGKTAAFALPILEQLHRNPKPVRPFHPRVLILCPTRELVVQIAEAFDQYGAHLPVRCCMIYGGVNQKSQVDALRRGSDLCIATPGRLLDLLGQQLINLGDIHTFVLDEADRMLDMGFIQDIRRIADHLGSQRHRQTLMFSATMPHDIRQLAQELLVNPVQINITPASTPANRIEQSVFFVEKRHKAHLLAHLYHELPMARTIVFTRTKHGADKLVYQLQKFGIRAEAIHSNKSQNARQRALSNFRSFKTPVLVATDIVSRGIDVDQITHVVNFDLTPEPETYVHRIGRTARAGASGHAISFCDTDERHHLRRIERLTKHRLTVRTDHPVYPENSIQVPSSIRPRTRDPESENRPSEVARSRPANPSKHRHTSKNVNSRERPFSQKSRSRSERARKRFAGV